MSERAAGDPALGDLLRRARRRVAGRPAIRVGDRETTYAELFDDAATCAAALARTVRPGDVVGLAAVLDPSFAAAYYGIALAGGVIAVLNPFATGETLRAQLDRTGIRTAFVTAAMRELIGGAGETVVLDDPGCYREFVAGVRPDPRAGTGVDPASPACIQFTSGTTGSPKAVLLSHRNLVTNASQMAGAHRLGPAAVTVNHLPTYHPMHLNSAVYGQVTQVLCPAADPAEAVAAANRHRATHLYSLPVRLARLAADPRLPELALDTVHAVFSGGSALPPDTAAGLGRHFGVPFLQGYGLAETSPLTHCDLPPRARQWTDGVSVATAPRPGTVGPPVAGTECRIVGLDTAAVLGPGERGEVQVRGPQVMLGYLGDDAPGPVDADGWLSTGDVGHQDDDGYLFLTDRIKDVFKTDNWLVAPGDVERVLARHPAVADCAVVGDPDPVHGEIAAAFVVLGPGPEASLAGVVAAANAELAEYQHIRKPAEVAAIPRSPAGKVLRRQLRPETAEVVP